MTVTTEPMFSRLSARPWAARLLALAAGAAYPLGFAPFAWRPVPVFALAVLFWLWAGSGPRRAAGLGLFFGLGLFGVGTSWIYNSIHLFGEAVAPLAGAITLGFVAVMALYPALAGYLAARLAPRSTPWRLLVLFPAVWVLFEWLRGWGFGGFPWLQLGSAQLDTPLAAWLPVLGEYGAGWAAALTAGALALVAGGRWRPAVAGVAVAWGLALLLALPSWTRPAGEPLQVTLVQGNISQERKWLPEAFAPTLAMYRRLTEQHWDSDVIIWPETAIPDFASNVRDDYLAPLAREARRNDTDLLVGLFQADAGGNYFNAMQALPLDRGHYRKRHLVPFGEYFPLRWLLAPLSGLLQVPMSDIAEGADYQPLPELGGVPAGVVICYETAFAREVRRALPEAAFLVNASNDAWFGDSLAPHQHLEIARVRAREAGRYLVRATSTGISAAIGPDGAVIARTPQFERAVLTETIRPRAGATPFVAMGHAPVVLGFLVLVGLAARRRRRERRSTGERA